jgi:hypothetical protein
VQAEPKPWQKLRPNASISLAKPMSFAVGNARAILSETRRLQQVDGAVHPFARLAIRGALRRVARPTLNVR